MHYNSESLIDYLHGELAPGEDAAVYAHLATCTDCRAAYDAEVTVSEALRSSSLAQERELPPMLKAQIWAAIRTQQPSLLDTLRGYLRPAYAVPLAAALIVAGYFGVPAARNGLTPATPGVSAAYYLDEHAAETQANPLAERALRINAADERTSSTPLAVSPATITVASAND